MVSIKVNDIIKEQRRNIISGLFIASFWLISSTAYYEALNRQTQLELLTAFLMLKEGYQNQTTYSSLLSRPLYSCDDPNRGCLFAAQVPWGPNSVAFDFAIERRYRCARIADDQVVRTFVEAKSDWPKLSVPSLPFRNFFLVSTKNNKFVYLGNPHLLLPVFDSCENELQQMWGKIKP
jgi:hypothetical protein